MSGRDELLRRLAAELIALAPERFAVAVIDGVDGSGKTCFADALAPVVEATGRPAVRASVDDFHHPRSVRYRQGRSSPVGYFEDSFDLTTLTAALLDPLGPGGDGRVRRRAFDHRADRAVDDPWEQAPAGAVLILDGIFAHRDELAPRWDWSVWLDVSPQTSARRCAERDGTDPDPTAASIRRYVEGQALYVARCWPQRRATHVIDNEDWEAPRLIR